MNSIATNGLAVKLAARPAVAGGVRGLWVVTLDNGCRLVHDRGSGHEEAAMAEPKKPGGDGPGKGKTTDGGGQTVLERDPKTHKPRLWKVVLHNDDYTTMEFVVWVLQMVFQKDQEEAMTLMLAVHQTGRGVAGVFTRDIAETKANQVMELAEANAMPLLCTTEPE